MIFSPDDLKKAIAAARALIVAHIRAGGSIEEIAGFSETNFAQVVGSWAGARLEAAPIPWEPLVDVPLSYVVAPQCGLCGILLSHLPHLQGCRNTGVPELTPPVVA